MPVDRSKADQSGPLAGFVTGRVDRTPMQQAAVEDALDGVNLAISYDPGSRVEAHLEVARTAILDAQSVLAERVS